MDRSDRDRGFDREDFMYREGAPDAPPDSASPSQEQPYGTPPSGGSGSAGQFSGGSKDSYTIGEVVESLKADFPTLSVSKIRYLERRRLINLNRTRGGYRLFSAQDVELLRYILTLQDKEYLPLKVIKKRIEGGGPVTGMKMDSAGDLSSVLEDRIYTREELADALEADLRFVEELLTVGVIGRTGSLTQRDLEVGRMAYEMSKYSIQPRHLRGIMAAVDREAAMFKQILNPELRSGDDHKVHEAMTKARHLASVDSRLKELMMANAIDAFDPSERA